MATKKPKPVVDEDDDYGDDEEMKDAPVWAKALHRALTNGGKRRYDRSDDDDESTEGASEDKPKPNRKHWLLG